MQMANKNKTPFEPERPCEKYARWDKQTKAARAFAKQCGINVKANLKTHKIMAEQAIAKKYGLDKDF